jgi:hypothetical protein
LYKTTHSRFSDKKIKRLSLCLPKGETIRVSKKEVPIRRAGRVIYKTCRVLDKAMVDAALMARKNFGQQIQRASARRPENADRDKWIAEQHQQGLSFSDIALKLKAVAKQKKWRLIGRAACWIAYQSYLKRQSASEAVPSKNGKAVDRLTLDQPRSPAFVSANEERDRWMYEERCKLVSWKSILFGVNQLAGERGWEPLSDQASCRAAIKRYWQSHRLAPPPAGKRGRPKNRARLPQRKNFRLISPAKMQAKK